MVEVYLGLGSNIGDRFNNIHSALELLPLKGVTIDQVSSILETDPWGGPPQGKYFNCVVKARTNLSPETLLKAAQEIEHELGRVRVEKNGPRTIDVDILLYDQKRINTEQLIVPHPRMMERHFVVMPLKEISPERLKDLV